MEELPYQEPWYQKPMIIIGALFLMLLMVISIVPFYAVRDNPEPTYIPRIEEVIMLPLTETSHRPEGTLTSLVQPTDPLMKQVATSVATFGCEGNTLCQAKAEYYFVRNNIIYVSETDEYLQTPRELLATRGGDCEDMALLLANLMEAIGVPTRFVHVPTHVYVKIYVPEAPKRYRDDEGWISLDPTCKRCGFGELPSSNPITL